ncbi:MAG: hypothetical protein P4M11_01640 [Candidatus Pacebacteria bacterium]|nr:hypothetical protein [Candidatus Paceibacterota bacterium]
MEHISTYTEEKSRKLSPKGPRFVRWAVMLGIVVVLNLFFTVIRSLVFPEPQYDNSCPATTVSAPETQSACTSAGGTWNGAAKTGYCDTTSKCNAMYQTAESQYQLNSFIMLIALGIVAIIVGVLPLGSSIVSTGLSYGGVLSFIIASVQYWGEAGNWLRLGISVIALVALIYIGIRRFRD